MNEQDIMSTIDRMVSGHDEDSDEEFSESDDVMEELIDVKIDPEATVGSTGPMQTLGWMKLKPTWPKRLLHVATMTSILRDDTNTYGQYTEPRYNILSYTWGRFVDPKGKPINIKGTTWSIPAIDEDHFTVQEFEAVIQQVGQDVEFVWLDVACIDQENNKEKMDEIGRQAGIFKNAYKAYIWLNRLKHSVLTDCIEETNSQLMDYVYKMNDMHLQAENPDEWTSAVKRGWTCTKAALEKVFSDHWFSSLWTLQESILRRDAFILSREGAEIFTSLSKRPWQLKLIASTCHEYYDSLLPYTSIPTARERNYLTRMPRGQALKLLSAETETATALCELIHQRGLGFVWTSNPNVAYGVGHYRTTKVPLDRIFGIMQIYGISCTQPDDSKEASAQLQELEDQFGRHLVAISPLLSQMFVHAEASKPRRSWLITQRCSIPPGLDIRGARFESDESNLCQMTVEASGNIGFSGKSWLFKNLLKSVTLGDSMSDGDFQQAVAKILQKHGLRSSGFIGRESNPPDPLSLEDAAIFLALRPLGFRQNPREFRIRPSSGGPQVSILLDGHCELPLETLDEELDFIDPVSRNRDEELYTLMIGIQIARKYGEDKLRVLLLGQIYHGLNIIVGLLLLLVHKDEVDSKADRWERIGLVVWHMDPAQYDLRQGNPQPPLPPWFDLEGDIQ